MEATEKKLKKSVKIRLQKEAAKAEKEANAGRQGGVQASLRNFPTAPRKMRLIADMIRGERVNVALNLLRFDHKHASNTMEKVLLSAIANWQQHNEEVNIEEADLYVKEVFVDGGRMLKRLQTAPQGRAHRIRKRSHHLTIKVDDRNASTESNQNTENK
ncbi:MAG: 50S ribosomal protein L22 [Cyclobacteriaceae bacterium]